MLTSVTMSMEVVLVTSDYCSQRMWLYNMVQVIVIYPNSLNAGFEKQGSLFCVYLWGEKDTWTTPFRCMVHRTQRWCLHVHISSSSIAASSHHIAQSSRLLCHNCVRQRKQLRYFVDVSLAMHCHKTTSKKEYTKGVQNVHFLKYVHILYMKWTSCIIRCIYMPLIYFMLLYCTHANANSG